MTKPPPVICVDFETEAIQPRPNYPPRPVSVGIKWPDESAYRILAWGHPTGNNCTEKQARGELKRAYASRYPMLFQNAVFDLDVAETHWELPLPDWRKIQDTLFLLFLFDPHAPSLSLKPSAERLLGIKPEEQDKMVAWILANVPEARQKPSTAGAYISRVPFNIVAPYLKGDLTRTLKLFNWLYPRIVEAGMSDAYDRERRLMPILLRNARRGMRVDVNQLEHDLPAMKDGIKRADAWLCRRLGDINMDSPKQLGEALLNRGVVSSLKSTPKGQPAVNKRSLTIDMFRDKKVYHALTYRGQMETAVNMFMEPWLELVGDGDLIHADWSQVRSPKGDRGDSKGARSGRIICSRPNLLNIPKRWRKAVVAGYMHPIFIKGLPELPFVRRYALPHKGKQWGRRDYNQQEVRLFGHFEEGPVMEGFLTNPKFDMHENVRRAEEAALVESGLRTEFDRDSAKTSVFGAFYGQGLTGLMIALKLRDPEDRPIGRLVHQALHRAAPSIGALSGALKDLARQGLPIRTIGGRLYYCEAPSYSEKFGRNMTWEHKLISYLIQGSGADVMKEAICRYYEHPMRQEEMLVTVYDEADIDLPLSAKGARQEMTVLKECMQSIECDVPLLSDGEVGPSWGALQPWKD